jgi:hypothetical protein
MPKLKGGNFFENFDKVKNNLIYAKTAQVLPYHKPGFEILNGQSFSVKFYRTPKAPSNRRAAQAQCSTCDLEKIFQHLSLVISFFLIPRIKLKL